MYTDDQIKQFIGDKGINDNPYAIYNYAKQFGVGPGRIDSVMGYQPGTSDNWIKQQGLQGLAGSAVGGTRATTGNYTDDQVRQFIADKGITDNPHAIQAFAQQYGVQPGQIDSALGAQTGQSAGWQQQQGLTGQMPAGYATAPAAQTAAPPNPYMPPPPAQMPQTTQQPGMPSMGTYQPNTNGNPYTPMASGGRPGGGGGTQNPYMQQIGDNITRQVSNNLQRNILPGIGRGAAAAGGYGGSRQGIAEGLAIGETNNNLAGQLANLYGGQFNQDRQFGLQSDALDLNVYNTNQNWMRQGQQDQLGLADRLLGLNQTYGVGNATQAQNAPLNYWQQFGNQASQFAGLGGSQTQNMQGNPYLGALGGGMAAGQLWKSWGG